MHGTAGRISAGIFDTETLGDTLVVSPTGDLAELAFQEIESGGDAVLDLLDRAAARNVVIDLQQVDHSGSTALGFFIRLGKRVRERQGRMAFCNVSEHEREILEVTSLSDLWPVCPSREAALAMVQG
jgi:anti-sigma B factor antagonist